jgi:XTP/dITP diphosphohydrolase
METASNTSRPVVVLGTRNRKKLEELEDHLHGLPIDFRTLADFPAAPDVVEDGTTFLENARKKAVTLARALRVWTLGEDSGLAVDALGGQPGVYSARYSGESASDESNNRKLLDALTKVPMEKRSAHYVCTIALADPQGTVLGEVEGRCNGRIGFQPSGNQGFGYDPLFIIPEYHKTFGELGLLVKRHLSHRSRAIAKLRPILQATVLGNH